MGVDTRRTAERVHRLVNDLLVSVLVFINERDLLPQCLEMILLLALWFRGQNSASLLS